MLDNSLHEEEQKLTKEGKKCTKEGKKYLYILVQTVQGMFY